MKGSSHVDDSEWCAGKSCGQMLFTKDPTYTCVSPRDCPAHYAPLNAKFARVWSYMLTRQLDIVTSEALADTVTTEALADTATTEALADTVTTEAPADQQEPTRSVPILQKDISDAGLALPSPLLLFALLLPLPFKKDW